MKSIKLKFVDWPYLVEENNTFILLLQKKYEVILTENPEYIFYSDFGKEHLNYDCIRIYYTPENLVPDFNICDYAIGFHYISFEDRYMRFPLYGLFKYRKDYEKALEKHIVTDKEINEKVKFCNFIYSNSNADISRHKFFDFLNNYKQVDSGGKFLNNIGGPVADKHEFQKNYKFSIAFENSSMNGYTTEKIVQAFAAKTIPIYWGDPNIEIFFNGKAFINISKYKSFKDVLERIKEIDNNLSLFADIIREPMLNIKDLDYTGLEVFLFNIFDKSPQNYRRSNSLRGKWYQDYHKKLALSEKKLEKFSKISNFFKFFFNNK